MVALDLVEASNARISTDLPAGLVAVFVGGTNGVGETTVRHFAKHATRPRAYIVGRSQEAGDRIVQECRDINPEGTFVFLKHETSLMRNVDQLCEELCEELRRKEEAINILCLTVGTLQLGNKTEEGIHYPIALTVHARHRLISNLLPHLQKAQNLRGVVTTFSGTFEGPINMSDFHCENMTPWTRQAQMASMITLGLEHFHQLAPEISFIHNFPGSVKSGIDRGDIGVFMRTLKTVFKVLAPLVNMPLEEAGERHLYLCTSARYSNGSNDDAAGVGLGDGEDLVAGISGRVETGVYSISDQGESAGAKVQKVLARLVQDGMVEKVSERIDQDMSKALEHS